MVSLLLDTPGTCAIAYAVVSNASITQILLISLVAFTLGSCASRPKRHVSIKNTPYTIGGVDYQPYSIAQSLGMVEEGIASWYGPDGWLGGSDITANGEVVTARSVSAAHKHLPLPCLIEVTNLRNGRRAKIRVNDRGPFIENRILDVSSRAAEILGFKTDGITDVRLRVLRVGD